MTPRRTPEELAVLAEDLERRIESGEWPGDAAVVLDGRSLREIRESHEDVVHHERRLKGRIAVALAEGHEWGVVALMMGLKASEARRRYGHPGATVGIWHVSIEVAAAGDPPAQALLEALLDELGPDAAVTGPAEEPADGRVRYGADIAVGADSPAVAATAAWADFTVAARHVGLPDWPVVRFEVVNDSELPTLAEDNP